MRLRAALWIALGLGSASCGYAPFTHAVRASSGLGDAGLGQIQFYMNEKCVFERQVNTLSGEVARGKLEMRQGQAIDVVRVPKHTPGVVEQAWPDRLSVSFAPGTWFYFGTRPAEGANSKYYLLGRFDDRSRRFAVLHAGQEYYQTSEEVCFLEVRRNLRKSKAKDRTTLRGRRVTD